MSWYQVQMIFSRKWLKLQFHCKSTRNELLKSFSQKKNCVKRLPLIIIDPISRVTSWTKTIQACPKYWEYDPNSSGNSTRQLEEKIYTPSLKINLIFKRPWKNTHRACSKHLPPITESSSRVTRPKKPLKNVLSTEDMIQTRVLLL